MIVHFPIALTLVGVVCELIRFYFRKPEGMFFHKPEPKMPCGELLLYIAAASAVAATLSGFFFTGTFAGEALDVRNLHMVLAVLSTAALVLTSLFYIQAHFVRARRPVYTKLGLSFYVLSALLIILTGHMGGNLVYTYMIGL